MRPDSAGDDGVGRGARRHRKRYGLRNDGKMFEWGGRVGGKGGVGKRNRIEVLNALQKKH